jgi:protoporphyrinogen oxidase
VERGASPEERPDGERRPDARPDVPLDVAIVGAGPAGLTAAYVLAKKGVTSTVLESDSVVGGNSRTPSRDGWRFDIGGHRFFTKVRPVEELWFEILGPDDFMLRPRLSRVYYRGKFYDYPIVASNALKNLGPVEAARCCLSYLWVRIRPPKDQSTLEGFVASRFGSKLYRIFFKTYTEKVWGIPCNEISADWAAQRIKGLSLVKAIRNAFSRTPANAEGEVIKTLIEEFEYPRLGPGMMWETAVEKIEAKGTPVLMASPVSSLKYSDGKLNEIVANTPEGPKSFKGSHFISSLPIRNLVRMMDPPAPPEVKEAAEALSYRDYFTVILVVNRPQLFPDNWIYIHDPSVRLGRIQNFKNWSPEMVPNPDQTALGLEYFCTVGDDLWNTPDEELIKLGKKEVGILGLVNPGEVEDGTVVRMKKAYPVYDEHYERNVLVVRKFIEDQMPNLQLVGRNGMHKYNNQDHSMMTALLAARRILGGDLDPWKVNTDAEYHEEIKDNHDTAGRAVPKPIS